MSIMAGSVALISGGRGANLGKIVFVVDYPDDPRLPCVGGGGELWDVQMIATSLIALDGREYLRIAIGEDWLMPIRVPPELAAEMRECGIANVLERAIEEMLQEDFGDDGSAASAGAECQKPVDGGDMTNTNDAAKQQDLALDYGTAAAKDVAEKACQLLINNRFIMSGDAGLQNVWEEIVVQVRGERTPFWEAYEAAMRDAVLSAMFSLCAADRTALWLKTDPGWDWRYDQDDESDATIEPPVDDEDIVMYIMKERLMNMADNFSNVRVERFLARMYVGDGDSLPDDEDNAALEESDSALGSDVGAEAETESKLERLTEKLAALNKELMEILAPPGPMRAEMSRLLEIEDEIMVARAEISKVWIANDLKAKARKAA